MKRAFATLTAALMMTASTAAFAQPSEVVQTAQPAPAADAVPETAPAPAPVQAADAAPEPYQVLRASDREMSCADLAYETNKLNAWLLAHNQAVVQKAANAKAAGGLLRSAGRFGLSRFGGGLGAMGAKAVDTANNIAADAVIANGQPTAGAVPEQQRMNHLLGLYKEKGC